MSIQEDMVFELTKRCLRERWTAQETPGDVTTRSELLALFDVIGSPSWADAEEVHVSGQTSYHNAVFL